VAVDELLPEESNHVSVEFAMEGNAVKARRVVRC
jgi:hypothetical protein